MQLIKPWGKEQTLRHLKGVTLKILTISGKLSLQKHNKKSEIWVVHKVEGRQGLKITIGDKRHYFADEGDIFEIPKDTIHRAEGDGEIIELSYEDMEKHDDDIVRLDDDYGRVKKVITT